MASLVADYGTDSDSSSEELDSESETKKSAVQSEKLPPPSFAKSVTSIENSVFVNPFVKAESAEKAILEKHVRMVPTKDNIKSINGKKICWMYRKGRCRFGHNCKFAHDSDIHDSSVALNIGDKPVEGEIDTNEVFVVDELNGKGGEEENKKKKKKRPGLCQTLKPGKKIMKMYKKPKLEKSNL